MDQKYKKKHQITLNPKTLDINVHPTTSHISKNLHHRHLRDPSEIPPPLVVATRFLSDAGDRNVQLGALGIKGCPRTGQEPRRLASPGRWGGLYIQMEAKGVFLFVGGFMV